MTYARQRLWIGVTAVGLNVMIALAVLVVGIPENTIWVMFAGYVIWMLPFDFLGGWWLPSRAGRSRQSRRGFLLDWLIGASLQSLVFLACGAGVLWAARLAGIGGAVVLLLLVFMLLLASRPLCLKLFSRPSAPDANCDMATLQKIVGRWGITCAPIHYRDGPTTGFTGGIVGLLNPRIIFPGHWRALLSLEELGALAARRSLTLSTGSHKKGLILAAAWTLSAFVAGNWMAGTIAVGPQTTVELTYVIAGGTLWNFLGLLLLPTVSRFATRRLDGMSISHVPKELLHAAQKKVDQVQDDEPHRPRGVELIFHPVPSVTLRQQRELKSEGAVPWHLARQVLFLSWGICNPLARAVHCNAGQSLLWICPPTD